jgi:hypothetical protein
MYFEFARENSPRMTAQLPRASDLHELFECALRNTAMIWRQAVERRLRRLGVSRLCWMTISAADAGMHLYFLVRDEVAAARREMLAIVDLEKLVNLTELLETLQEPRRTS